MRLKHITSFYSYRWLSILLGLLLSSLVTTTAKADRIILKDGTTIESDRVWQSKDHIHFILKGTRDVEIRYAREIVAKIETPESVVIPKPAQKLSKPAVTGNKVVAKPKRRSGLSSTKATPPVPETSQAPKSTGKMDNTLILNNRGLSFYDPRRKKRYWASRNSKHDTLDNALQALANIYARTPLWAATNMGEENNLAVIHDNLSRKRNAETLNDKGHSVTAPKPRLQLYAKDRPLPFLVGPGQGYKTRIEALDALARQYNGTAEWVQRLIGNQNDLQIIHQKLTQAAKSSSHSKSKIVKKPGHRQPSQSPLQGVLFYNPRRDHKYWTSNMARHNTLQEALQALADQYGVPIDWIEAHMGNTNDLSTIHRNIKNSLK